MIGYNESIHRFRHQKYRRITMYVQLPFNKNEKKNGNERLFNDHEIKNNMFAFLFTREEFPIASNYFILSHINSL